MKNPPRILFAVLLMVAAGCTPATQREAEKAAKELRETGDSLRQIGEEWAETLAASTGEWSQVWQEFQGTLGVHTNATPIPFRSLKDLLPSSFDDWEAAAPTGGHEKALGVGVSRAEVALTRADGAVATIRIHDAGAIQPLTTLAGRFADLMQFERESDAGYERPFTWNGHRGFERYHHEKREGSKRVWIAGVFEVQVEARSINEADLDVLLNTIDLERLLTLKMEANTAPPES